MCATITNLVAGRTVCMQLGVLNIWGTLMRRPVGMGTWPLEIHPSPCVSIVIVIGTNVMTEIQLRSSDLSRPAF